jgi:hypothetical protein
VSKLQDYSGPYQANLKLEDFSKEAIVRLVQLYSRFYQALDGFWYLAVKEKIDNEQALTCDIWVWEKLIRYQVKHLSNALSIQGDDVVTLMKIFQVDPWFWHFGYGIELMDKNHGVFTVNQCPTLEALEKEGGGRIKTICGKVEPIIFKQYATSVNPDMQVKALKLPPRQSREELCCQWEFFLE